MAGFGLAFMLAGCSGSFQLGPPAPKIVPPVGAATVIEPNGEIVEEAAKPPIETVLTGLAQAQQTRTLVRQLAR